MNINLRRPHRPHARCRSELLAAHAGFLTSAEICDAVRSQHGHTVTQQTVRKRCKAAGIPAARITRVNDQGIPLGGRPALAWPAADVAAIFNLNP